MTSENVIDAAQAEMDATQEGSVSTTEQIQSLRNDNTTLRNEVRGLQGRIDKGLSDITSALDARNQQETLAGIPEEYRQFMSPVLDEVAKLKGQVSQLSTQASPGTGSTGNSELDQFLGGMGLNSNSPGLDLVAYNKGDMDTFLASARQAVVNTTAPAPSVSTPPPNPPSPPVDGVPAANVGGSTEEEIQMEYISNQIDYDTYAQKMSARGFQH